MYVCVRACVCVCMCVCEAYVNIVNFRVNFFSLLVISQPQFIAHKQSMVVS